MDEEKKVEEEVVVKENCSCGSNKKTEDCCGKEEKEEGKCGSCCGCGTE
ncbi:MAG: hypothetical protein WCX46_01320 [Candidatus Paceibacterota bacterium]